MSAEGQEPTQSGNGQEPQTPPEPNIESETPPASGQEPQSPVVDPKAPVDMDALPDNVKNLIAELRNENASHRKANQEARKAAEAAERKAAEEQGKYKELYEEQMAKAQEAEVKAKAAELNLLRAQAAAELPEGLREELTPLLQGETLDELTDHAKRIAAKLPKQPAPNINSDAGTGGAPRPGQMSDAERQEMAAVYGVNPNYLPQ